MVASVPVKFLFAQDPDVEPQDSKSWFEQQWDHNEQETLSKLPADLKDELLKVKEVDLEQYGELLHDAAHARYDEHHS